MIRPINADELQGLLVTLEQPGALVELGAMLRSAGFASWKEIPTHLPLVCGAIVARA